MCAYNLGGNRSAHRNKPLSAETRPTRTALTVALLLALGITTQAHATNFTVRNASDSGPGTLRQAVLDANAAISGHHNIHFALPAGSTITLTSGQIALTGPDITMQGPGQNALTISGNHHSRIFDVEAGNLTLADLTLRDGLALGDATNLYDEVGGAIRVGPLPAAISAAEFSASLAAARRKAQAEAISSDKQRAARRTNLRALKSLQSREQSNVSAAQSLTLDRVALLDNRADAPDLAIGGAVAVLGGANLVIRDSVISGNSTSFAGGAIFAMGANDLYGGLIGAGSFDIADSLFTGNHIDQNGAETGQGAAITLYGPGGTINRSVFSNNVINDAPPEQDHSEGIGGALEIILADLPISIVNSELSGNTIALRPGVYSEGAGLYCYIGSGGTTPLTITNTTISGNYSESGAAIEASCNLQLFNSTLADNIAPTDSVVDAGGGGGDAVEIVHQQGKFSATSTLIYNPDAARADLYVFHGTTNLGTISKSLIFAPDPSTPLLPPDTIIGVDPLLAALANNGGPTRTQALLPGSPAIDAGSNPQGLTFDQRGAGFPRVFGAAPDIGAFEGGPRSVSHGRP
jgi:hypothetical protein